MTAPAAPRASSGGASLVAAGILLSRLFGLVRQRALGHFLGAGAAADAFSAALVIPNVLQNLFGEGVLSASFIPVYARLVARGDEREAGRVAGAVAALLALTASVLVLLGIAAAPLLVALIAAGADAPTQALTVKLVRVLFPGVGLLVLSSWCLGILNSHRRFFLSYVSPVAWNIAIIAALAGFAPGRDPGYAATVAAWGSVIGSALQFLVQLPTVLKLDRAIRLSLAVGDGEVRRVFAGFAPVFVGRGVVQISGWIDQLISSFVSGGAMAILFYARNLSLLPVSLFGMSVSAAELPALSEAGGVDAAPAIRSRLDAGLSRIAFFVVPSAMVFLVLGDVVAAAVYESGRFTHDAAIWVWGVLAGSSVGLLASTLGRLYSSAFYALRDTVTPLRFAVARVVLSVVLGYVSALHLPRWLGVDPRWGIAALTATSGIAAWMEFTLLQRAMNARIGATGIPLRRVLELWWIAALAAIPALGVKVAVRLHPVAEAAMALSIFGAMYLGLAALRRLEGVAEVRRGLNRFLGR